MASTKKNGFPWWNCIKLVVAFEIKIAWLELGETTISKRSVE